MLQGFTKLQISGEPLTFFIFFHLFPSLEDASLARTGSLIKMKLKFEMLCLSQELNFRLSHNWPSSTQVYRFTIQPWLKLRYKG